MPDSDQTSLPHLPRRGGRAGTLPLRQFEPQVLPHRHGGGLSANGDLHVCSQCRYAAFFAPPTAAEEFAQRQALQESLSPVEKFEQTFRSYTEKQLQKVIDGKDYVPDAKKAAKNLLYRRRYGE